MTSRDGRGVTKRHTQAEPPLDAPNLAYWSLCALAGYSFLAGAALDATDLSLACATWPHCGVPSSFAAFATLARRLALAGVLLGSLGLGRRGAWAAAAASVALTTDAMTVWELADPRWLAIARLADAAALGAVAWLAFARRPRALPSVAEVGVAAQLIAVTLVTARLGWVSTQAKLGQVCPELPHCRGDFWLPPPIGPATLVMGHRAAAIAIVVTWVAALLAAPRGTPGRTLARYGLALALIAGTSGAAMVRSGFTDDARTAHAMASAIIAAMAVLYCASTTSAYGAISTLGSPPEPSVPPFDVAPPPRRRELSDSSASGRFECRTYCR